MQGCPCARGTGAGRAPARFGVPARRSSNLCSDGSASPFPSANTTCFLRLWRSGGRAKQERKDRQGPWLPWSGLRELLQGWAVAEAEAHGAVPGQTDGRTLAALDPLTKGEGSSDEGQKDQVFSTAASQVSKDTGWKAAQALSPVAPWLSVDL